MKQKNRLELLNFENHIGVYDPVKKKRLKNLCPKKSVDVRAKASAFEGGYTSYSSYDLHQKLKGKRTISKSEYNKLSKDWKCK